MTVLLTGAAGSIGTSLRESLPRLGWDVRAFDRVAIDDGFVGDLTDPAALNLAVDGVDAIVHLAGQPTEAPWRVIRDANIDGVVNLFEAARQHGVRRVVFASSNHAVGYTPAPTGAHLPADVPPRPDTLYGVSKAFGEALGRYYVERYEMQVACLRIGTFGPRPLDRRGLSTWLSPADCARLVDACLRAETLTSATVWGVSGNTGERGLSPRVGPWVTNPSTTPNSSPQSSPPRRRCRRTRSSGARSPPSSSGRTRSGPHPRHRSHA